MLPSQFTTRSHLRDAYLLSTLTSSILLGTPEESETSPGDQFPNMVCAPPCFRQIKTRL